MAVVKQGIYCRDISDIPHGEHYAIIEFSTMTDSYDGQTSVQKYIAYTDKKEWEDAVASLTMKTYANKFVAIKATRATIKTTVTVE